MVIGGVPLTVIQSMVTLYPSKTYAGFPILTLLFPSVMLTGVSIWNPSSIHGGTPKGKMSIEFYHNFNKISYKHFVCLSYY